MATPSPDQPWTRYRARLAAFQRHGNRSGAEQARRDLALARFEKRIRDAVEQAPPLDQATVTRLRELFAPVLTDDAA